jgi:hypothetical protein
MNKPQRLPFLQEKALNWCKLFLLLFLTTFYEVHKNGYENQQKHPGT